MLTVDTAPEPRAENRAEDAAADVEARFRAFIEDRNFPCVGAKSALSRGTLRTVRCRSITSNWNDLDIYEALLDWSHAYREDPSLFRSVAFLFADDAGGANADLSEQAFEAALWARVQSLTDKDAFFGLPYDTNVSSDPDDPHFSLSFGGEAFFVVGMHPGASRPARRFECPVMVFNLHDQFEQLREQGRYEKIRDTILERDVRFAGSPNPMLARHGESSEAAQYSGRLVGPEWTCPFRDPRASEA